MCILIRKKGCVFNLRGYTACGCMPEDIGNYLLFYHGEKAIHHLFQVKES